MTTRNEAAERLKDEVPFFSHLIDEALAAAKAEGVREAVERIRQRLVTATALNDRLIGVRLIHKWLDKIEQPERESSIGRDAEGHLTMTLGPGAESPSRKEGWDELDGLSPLEQYNREGR